MFASVALAGCGVGTNQRRPNDVAQPQPQLAPSAEKPSGQTARDSYLIMRFPGATLTFLLYSLFPGLVHHRLRIRPLLACESPVVVFRCRLTAPTFFLCTFYLPDTALELQTRSHSHNQTTSHHPMTPRATATSDGHRLCS